MTEDIFLDVSLETNVRPGKRTVSVTPEELRRLQDQGMVTICVSPSSMRAAVLAELANPGAIARAKTKETT